MAPRSWVLVCASAAVAASATAQPQDPYADEKPAEAPSGGDAPARPRDPYGDADDRPRDPYDPPSKPKREKPAPPAKPGRPLDPYRDDAPAPAGEGVGKGPQDPYQDRPSRDEGLKDPYLEVQGLSPEMAESVAAALVVRARELIAVRAYGDARQLAVEALVLVRQGPTADAATAVIAQADRELAGDGPIPVVTAPPSIVDDAVLDPYLGSGAPVDDGATRFGKRRAFTIGSGALLAGLAGGFIADVADTDDTVGSDIVLGAGLGAAVGAGAGFAIARSGVLDDGDVALIDSLALWGAAGGLSIGAIMQPYEDEAYSMNALLGLGLGAGIGFLARGNEGITPERMLRVNAWALGGAAVPWLVYAIAEDPDSTSDERLFGVLSTAGLAVGAYVGFRTTRRKAASNAAPQALLERGRSGWQLGSMSLRPLPPSQGRGAVLDIAGGTF